MMKTNYFIYVVLIAGLFALLYQANPSDNSRDFSFQNSEYSQALQEEPVPVPEQLFEENYISNGAYTTEKGIISTIGVAPGEHIDNPKDNTIEIFINGDIPVNQKVYLEYDLFGLEDFNSVCRSINDNLSIGGQVLRTNNVWSHQSEMISATQLRNGINRIRFSVPEESNIAYQVKNVNFRIENETYSSRQIVLNQTAEKRYYGEYAYVNGFVFGADQNTEIMANGQKLRFHKGAFDGLIKIDEHNEVLLTAKFTDGESISTTIEYDSESKYNFLKTTVPNVAYAESYVTPATAMSMELDAFSLKAEAGFISNAATLNITGLRNEDMALLDAGMINVTAQHKGYRCLPHGSNFDKSVSVSVGYDPTLIPAGYGPDDIRTFYFNDEIGKWEMLPFDSLDKENNAIISKTLHFTDFINSILKTPEAPQTQAFTPTSMKDMKFAEPLAGVNMISPPSANNSGTANMSLPIQIPAGRQGMQPQLGISYNSEGGNGPLGVGWNMQIPSITVETKWGVPTYNNTYESEEYLVNGQQILQLEILAGDTTRKQMLHMDGNSRVRVADSTDFSYRVEGAFHRIKRYGDSPDEYWWEVTDKQGTKYFYGKYHYDSGVNDSLVLSQPGSGNIAHWALAEVKDVYGNYVRYEYTKGDFQDEPGHGGQQLYIHKITYTGLDNGSVTENGKYTIDFDYIGGRTDYQIAGNYGFLVVTDSLLKKILIEYDNDFVRRYEIVYKTGAYDKTLICGIMDITDELFNTIDINCNSFSTMSQSGVKVHYFDYYEKEGLEFENNTSIVTSTQEFQESVLNGGFTVNSTQSIGSSRGLDVGYGGSLCLGLGSKVTTKNNAIGGSLSWSKGYLREKIQILDMNGDGLPDKIVSYNTAGINYFTIYKGVLSNGILTFDPTPHFIPSLPNLGINTSKTKSSGKEIQIGIGPAKGSASTSKSNTSQRTDYYFADINADGYIDYVSNGTIYYNEPNSNGIPVFHAENGSTVQTYFEDPCYFTIHDGEVDSSFNEYLEEDSTILRRDPVKMWIADDENIFIIQSSAKRIKPDPDKNATVYYTIQLNSTVLFCDSIAPNDTLAHDINLCPVQVFNDDRLYFRMHSKNNSGTDDIFWDPKLLYSSNCPVITTNSFDPNEKSYQRYVYSEDAVIHDGQYFTAPLDGHVIVKGHLTAPAQSDSLHFLITHNLNNLMDTIYLDSISFDTTFYYNIAVNEDDSIHFKLLSNTNVAWSEIDFFAQVQYYQADSISIDTTNPYTSINAYPSVELPILPKVLVRVDGVSLAAGRYIIKPNFSQGSANLNGTVVFTAKSKRNLLAKKNITIQNGLVVGSQFQNRLVFTLFNNDTVYFEYFSEDEELLSLFGSYVTNARTLANYGQCGRYTIFPDSMRIFGNLYQGWGQFSYYDSTATACSAIDESKLFLDFPNVDSAFLTSFPLTSIDTTMSFAQIESIFDAQGIPDIYSMPFMPMQADRENDKWIDVFNSAYCEHENMGSASGLNYLENTYIDSTLIDLEDMEYLLLDFDNPLVASNPYGAKRTVSKFSESTNKSFSFSLGITGNGGPGGGSFSSTSTQSSSWGKLDFMDMNGDRYPDIVGYDKIQYTNPQGGISDKKLICANIYPSEGSGTSHSRSFGVQPVGFLPKKTSESIKSKLDNFSGNGVGSSNGESNVVYIYADINGDGLNDRIDENANEVQLSLGYNFNSQEYYNIANISESFSNAVSVSLGFNTNNFSWSGGVNGSLNLSNDNYSMIDVNGDGLIDICFVSGSDLLAFINTGNGFQTTPETLKLNFLSFIPGYNGLPSINSLNATKSYNIGGNISGTGGIPIWLLKITLSGYFNANYSISPAKHQLRDINGDNTPDFIYVDESIGIPVVLAKYGIPQKVNMLKTVTTPGKSEYYVDYEKTYPNRENPNSKWVMSSTKVYDGFVGDGYDTTYYKYEYDSAYYHRMERESFGYKTVTTKQYDNFSPTGICYRTTTEKYHNDYFLFKGLKKY
ncbi:MAG: hypothetical protein JXR53_06920, partial [Bacteroidales bacterium]|nr:hypothetical protein [Bacteroidales bacterium]